MNGPPRNANTNAPNGAGQMQDAPQTNGAPDSNGLWGFLVENLRRACVAVLNVCEETENTNYCQVMCIQYLIQYVLDLTSLLGGIFYRFLTYLSFKQTCRKFIMYPKAKATNLSGHKYHISFLILIYVFNLTNSTFCF